MFRTKKSNESQHNSTSSSGDSSQRNLIGKGTEIHGEIISEGIIRIDGKLKGYLESKSKVVIGPTGFIEGEIVCDCIDVFGKILGKVNAKNIVYLKETADVQADIVYNKFVVDSGAVFVGNCSMGTKVLSSTKTSIPKAPTQLAKEAV